MFARWWCVLSLISSVLGMNQTRPHIIFILADDLGWNDVGFHGSDQVPTPNIDALAYSGVILNNYYVLPVCTPSRSALMTGRHPVHTGMQHEVIFANEPWGLPLEEKLLPQYLQELGYVNRMVGKWHLGHFRANYTPLYRGFDSHYGYWGGHQDYYDHTAQDSLRYWGYDMRRDMNVHWASYGRYTTDLFSEEAVRTILQHDEARPLFLYLAHLATHSANPYRPLQAPADVVNKFSYIADEQRRIFAGMLSKLDQCIGDVVAALELRGMLNNSIIIFSTDNGGPAAGFNLNAASNWPLRGVKDTLWEGGVRGVGLVWSPLIRSAPRVATHLMHIQDWLPSLLHAVNATVPSHLDGQDVWTNILTGSPPPYDELLLNIDNQRDIAALRKGDWKLVKGRTWDGQWDGWYGPSGRKPGYRYNVTLVYNSVAGKALVSTGAPLPLNPEDALRTRAAANVSCGSHNANSSCAGPNSVCLFNLMQDPCELDNLSNKYPLRVAALQRLLDRYNATVVPPLNKEADPRSNPKYWNYTWTNWMDQI
ncbi:arylsulfatase B-like isoform X1 [Cryptotermes secundus]|uniref:arylsulfatase B-like isoform X1 n=1 Tax=Cryptotermes secundus TaxID=105785 RepID=UPI000CD7AD3E|nr:arylsulfatase B-like isoform X1 [Cryptotermes secundus]XP_023720428.1 arylsulfatase B-like isoform X1 [Cryptotermes secundus]